MKSFWVQVAGILLTVMDEIFKFVVDKSNCDGLGEGDPEVAELELEVAITSELVPEQAVLAETPAPNSLFAPVLIAILPPIELGK